MEFEINFKPRVTGVIAFFLLSALLFLSSTGDKGKCRIKKMTNLRSNHSSEYFYNSKGLITEVKDLKGNSTRYEYLSGKIIKTILISGTVKNDTIFLDRSGLVDEIHESTGGLYKFTFTKDSFFIEAREFYKGDLVQISSEEYAKGNERMGSFADEHGKKINIIYYEYYPNTNNIIGNENMGMIFMGRSSINLIKKSITTVPDSVIGFYNYHFDDKGRVSIKASYGKDGKLADSTGYSYY